jgi:hypothetical protein
MRRWLAGLLAAVAMTVGLVVGAEIFRPAVRTTIDPVQIGTPASVEPKQSAEPRKQGRDDGGARPAPAPPALPAGDDGPSDDDDDDDGEEDDDDD